MMGATRSLGTQKQGNGKELSLRELGSSRAKGGMILEAISSLLNLRHSSLEGLVRGRGFTGEEIDSTGSSACG